MSRTIKDEPQDIQCWHRIDRSAPRSRRAPRPAYVYLDEGRWWHYHWLAHAPAQFRRDRTRRLRRLNQAKVRSGWYDALERPRRDIGWLYW